MSALFALAANAAAYVTISATSPTGTTPVAPGGTFSVNLSWSGTPAIGAADYAVTLNTNQLLYTGRTFNTALTQYADSLYLPTLPVATNRVDLTWFKAGGFTGNDVTLQFKVPDTYTGPSVITVGLVVKAVQDATTVALPATTIGTSVNVSATTALISSASSSGTAPRTANWVTGTNALTWSSGIPGTTGNADQAVLNLASTSTSGDFSVDLNQDLTLNKLTVNMSGTVNYRIGTGTRRTVTWVPSGTQSAVFEFVRIANAPLRNSFDGNSVLNTDLAVRLSHQGAKDSYFGGIVSGTGRLTVDYYDNFNNSSGGNFRLGTAGDAPSTHTGGTRLLMSAGTVTPATFRFWTAKTNAFGSGLLELNKVRLDLAGFAQTVGGLGDGTNGSIITDLATSTTNGTTTTLGLTFSGTRSFAGQITDGPTRKLALSKAGTGIQVLTAANTYTGATTVSAGRLVVDGSLASGTATTVQTGAFLGGSGTVSGPTNNQGTIAPGDSLGTLTAGAVTMGPASRLEIQVANWASTTPGSGWDLLSCASLAMAGTSTQPVLIKLAPLSLAGFTESAKTLTIATSASLISGFSSAAIAIDPSSMPGTGTWSAKVDSTGRSLQIVYSPGTAAMTMLASPTTQTIAASESTDSPTITTASTTSVPVPNARARRVNRGTPLLKASPFSPLSGGLEGVLFSRNEVTDKGNGQSGTRLLFTIAVRRGAVFATEDGAQVSSAIDGMIYRVEASPNQFLWNLPVADLGASTLPPAKSNLPDLTGSEWEYHTFSAFEDAPVQGFVRAMVATP